MRQYKEAPSEDFVSRPLEDGVLAERGRDLTYEASQGKLKPAFGRHKEITQIIEVLGRFTKCNPILVGEAGVGKTAIVEGIAQVIVRNTRKLPPWIAHHKIVETSFEKVISTDRYCYSEYINRLQKILKEVKAKPIILFFDEIYKAIIYFEGGLSVIKPPLARGELRIIGATTYRDFHKLVDKDPALGRRFYPIEIKEPSEKETKEIVSNLIPTLKEHFEVDISPKTVQYVVELSNQYLHSPCQPDKTIDILESACVRARGFGEKIPFPMVSAPLEVTPKIIREILSERTGVPAVNLDISKEKYLHLESALEKRIIGQDHAIERIAKRITTSKLRADLAPHRPDGVFLLVGPTGVGKTELARQLAIYFTGTENGLIHLDMSGMTMSKIMGASPGTTRYEDSCYLSDRVLKNPSGVLLLDEIEKTHTDILYLFMRIMDEGKFSDSQGRDVYFSNLTIIMTTNIGCSNTIGFIGSNADHSFSSEEESRALDRIEKYFPTEFLNRIDDVVVFRPLDKIDAKKIIRLKLRDYQKSIKKRFFFTDSVVDLLRQEGFSEKYGARNLRRAIDTLLGYEIANLKLKLGENWDKVQKLKITIARGKIRCEVLGQLGLLMTKSPKDKIEKITRRSACL